MTAVCPGGGPSDVKPGVAGTLIALAGGSALMQGVPALAPIAPWVAQLGTLAYDLTVICPQDPPAFPTFDAGDIFALAIADAGPAGHTARQKVADTVQAIIWYQSCQCITGPQPTQPTPPAAPPVPALTGPAGVFVTTPCAQLHGIFTATPVVGGFGSQNLIWGLSGGTVPFFNPADIGRCRAVWPQRPVLLACVWVGLGVAVTPGAIAAPAHDLVCPCPLPGFRRCAQSAGSQPVT